MPSFTQVLLAVVDAWRNRRQELAEGGGQQVAAIERQMTGSSGGFYCTQDADSEGEGGKFFVWTQELLRLAGLAVEPRYLELARAALGQVQEMLARYPFGFTQWLIALDYVLSHPHEVTIVGDAMAVAPQALLDVCGTGYRPHQIIALGEPGAEPVAVSLLQGRGQIAGVPRRTSASILCANPR